jgi:hypothetical protein
MILMQKIEKINGEKKTLVLCSTKPRWAHFMLGPSFWETYT